MTREEDIQSVINGVLETSLNFWDNPNGGYEYDCPFCSGGDIIGGKQPEPTIGDIKHNMDCIWLIARDLNTNS